MTCCRFLLDGSRGTEHDLQLFRFLGILMGVAIRTKKPLDLHLAPMVRDISYVSIVDPFVEINHITI